MKLTKLATVVALSGVLTVLMVSVVSAAPARSKQVTASKPAVRYAVSATADITETDDLTDTEDVSSTKQLTQSVAGGISFFFGATYAEIMALHTNGLGFGEIARAYFIAKLSNGSITPQQVLDLKAGGLGWGEIMKQVDFKPGKGNNLGAIMSSLKRSSDQHSGHSHKSVRPVSKSSDLTGDSTGRGNSSNAPGHNKSKSKH